MITTKGTLCRNQASLEWVKTALNNSMQEFLDKNCENPEWDQLNFLVGNDTASLMADAAFAALNCAIESQHFYRNEMETDI